MPAQTTVVVGQLFSLCALKLKDLMGFKVKKEIQIFMHKTDKSLSFFFEDTHGSVKED